MDVDVEAVARTTDVFTEQTGSVGFVQRGIHGRDLW